VAYGGLDAKAALRGITLSTAEILGVADKIGSIQKGKEATLFICDGDVLEVTSKTETLFVQGKLLPTTNKQSELAEKYREKYRQQRGNNGSRPVSAAE
jgi:imidazolonepropionase-like amidohydrolase